MMRFNPAADRKARAAQLRIFLHACAGSSVAEQADRLREAARLFGLPCDAEAQRAFAAMIDCGAFESAAVALLAEEGRGFILSRSGTGTCLASAALADGSDELVAEGASLALALLQAHASALLAECDRAPTPGIAAPRARNGARLH